MVRIYLDNMDLLSESNSELGFSWWPCPEAASFLSSMGSRLFYTVWKALDWAGIMTGVAPMRVRFPGLSLGGGLGLELELEVDVEVGVERGSGVLGTV